MSTAKNAAPGPERLLTQREVAEIFRLQPDTIKHWRFQGKIGYLELAHNVIRIPQSEVERLLEEGRRGCCAQGETPRQAGADPRKAATEQKGEGR